MGIQTKNWKIVFFAALSAKNGYGLNKSLLSHVRAAAWIEKESWSGSFPTQYFKQITSRLDRGFTIRERNGNTLALHVFELRARCDHFTRLRLHDRVASLQYFDGAQCFQFRDIAL